MRQPFALFLGLFVTLPLLANDVTIHGFVTDVKSPTSFAVDDYRVIRDNSLTVYLASEEGGNSSATLDPKEIRIGTEVEIQGDYNDQSGELKAQSIKVFLDDTRIVKRTALLEKLPALKRSGSGWEGEIRADGERIHVLPATPVLLIPNKSEQKYAPGKYGSVDSGLTSLDQLNLDTFLHYEGTRGADGAVEASRVEFWHAELEPGEAKMWRHLEPNIKDPDYARLVPGELEMASCVYQGCAHEIVPIREAQDYVAKLGGTLIPAFQRDLPADNPEKIPFRFYVIRDKTFNAVCYPNGLVLVHSGVFDVLQNEAQLASVLAHEISHALEKHAWRARNYRRNELMAHRASGAFVPYAGPLVSDLAVSTIRNEFTRSLENQADRVGLALMLAAGYDIREAPASWKALSMKKGAGPINPFWSSHDNKTTRRSYLMAALKNTYPDLDCSRLKIDSEEFHRVAELLSQSKPATKAGE